MDTQNSGSVETSVDLVRLKRTVFGRFVAMALILGLFLFLPAGSLNYWQAWVYIVILLLPVLLVATYLLRHDPELLDRRMRLREREPAQKVIVSAGYPLILVAFLVPGFDYRFGWSSVAVPLVVLGQIGVLAGYFLFLRVLRENRYASRVIEVEKGQTVVATGPYALVRHPMYLAAIVIYLCSPLALASFWALVPFATLSLLVVFRIIYEEKVLERDLEGYRDYLQNVRYRLIPGIW